MRHRCILHKSIFFNITKNVSRNFWFLPNFQYTQRKIYKNINPYVSVNLKKYSTSTNQVLYEVLKLQDKNTSNSVTDVSINYTSLNPCFEINSNYFSE